MEEADREYGNCSGGNHEKKEDRESEEWREPAAATFRAGEQTPAVEETDSVDCESPVRQSSSADVAESQACSG